MSWQSSAPLKNRSASVWRGCGSGFGPSTRTSLGITAGEKPPAWIRPSISTSTPILIASGILPPVHTPWLREKPKLTKMPAVSSWMTIWLSPRSVTTPRIRTGGLVASSAKGKDRTTAIGWRSRAESVVSATAGDELRPHHAPAQATMTPPSVRNVLEPLVPIMKSLLSRPMILACVSAGCPAAVSAFGRCFSPGACGQPKKRTRSTRILARRRLR